MLKGLNIFGEQELFCISPKLLQSIKNPPPAHKTYLLCNFPIQRFLQKTFLLLFSVQIETFQFHRYRMKIFIANINKKNENGI